MINTLYVLKDLWVDINNITDSIDMSLKKFQKTVKDRDVCHAAVHRVERARHGLATEQQQAIAHY